MIVFADTDLGVFAKTTNEDDFCQVSRPGGGCRESLRWRVSWRGRKLIGMVHTRRESKENMAVFVLDGMSRGQPGL